MKTTTGALEATTGTDERLLATGGNANGIVNMRWNPQGWWANDRGYEPLQYRAPGFKYTPPMLAAIRFFSIWTRHHGAEVYYLYEQDGVLQYDYGNYGGGSGNVQLATGRTEPNIDDPGTQLVPYGRFALFLNGYNAPIKFFGAQVVEPFGFPAAPPPPVIMGVDPQLKLQTYTTSTGAGTADDTCALGRGGFGNGMPFLGDPSKGATSSYSYRVSWVSSTGSESPMSSEVIVAWQVDDGASPDLTNIPFAVYLQTLPIGPDHVVARRIYRTKNMGDNTSLTDRTFYFVAQVDDNATGAYVDTRADTLLILAAPDPQASGVMPPGLRFGAAFDGRMWLGGGNSCPTRIIYSEKALPEQFGVFNYFDLGATGGAITALIPQDGRLYVFRERGIDVVQITVNLEYFVTTLPSSVGTTATNTIKEVPGYGLVFLSRDGIYSLLDGAVRRISDDLAEEMTRIGSASLARATATYSSREAEYWCQYPADGAAENMRGAVLHLVPSTPERPVWSLRHVTPTDGTSGFRAIVTALATDPAGWIVFGVSPINLTTGAYPGTELISNVSVNDAIENMGLQVWSARPFSGTLLTVSSVTHSGDGAGFVATASNAAHLESEWRSSWRQYSKRGRVLYIQCWMLNTGRPDLVMEFAVDGRNEWFEATGFTIEAEPAEVSATPLADNVYTPAAFAALRGYSGVWDRSRWREDRIARVRWDTAAIKGACSAFAFRLRSRDQFALLGYIVSSNETTIDTQSQVYGERGTS